ncbi:MAG: SCO family protein [Flavobacteriaceae bacterium CG_4_8_14_3_um_filter_34_10]|nr:SCO family protein [Flavobacteriia bacterium]PIQ17901.1 MAG: SCO family protein [Flavobacteriaceae bacterium CG18_big_fil_WC_8_21_14_2_50_34_36]PIV51813.1 MAG: SCO family protein [Flavobacteriaceae bacterium CG02_land_8_20_14_3_00_34_13]PIX09628.1 MAG: SCO family protein [Flavobacteriaceae bacterium CG_4_8_14_3_um_filter_34_10]PIZ08912.1 MAG: SCO family protein [Flavobacteriaceae bacterium CG_4_10_14_0_8_um_filter_34_31]PJC07603.1 MAG: SCO family protein [Flavobacteriaceae bacterium CG_4_9_
MIKSTNIHLLSCLILFLLGSCAQKEKENNTPFEANISKVIPLNEMDEMSIYNLPSQWNTQDGKTIELKDLNGNILVAVMIYTSCKAACPRLVADMRNIDKKVGRKNKKNVLYLLVSIDPVTDTPERLKLFSKENNMEENYWLFLQGTEDTVREFANVLAVKYNQISPIDFSHSNIISVFDAQGVLRHQQEGLGIDNEETVAEIIKLSK